MTNMIKMELYRFFHSASTWIILFIDMLLAFLSVMLVSTNTSIQIYSNAGELLAAQINGGMLMVLCAVPVIVFVSAKYKHGFIKNVANQLPRREILVFPEVISAFAACALHFAVYSFCTIIAGAILLGNTFITFSAIMKLLIVQVILHWSFCCLILLFYMLTGSTTFTMAAGLLIAFKILNIFYGFIKQFTHFNIDQFMLDSNIFQVGMYSERSVYTRAIIVGLIFLLAEIVLLCMVMRNKEIK
ncbi:MAG: hypothetical protein NC313_03250 [Butyrivibrio sp.]|nr:hypothetical protein [Butyrivibrio sp.]